MRAATAPNPAEITKAARDAQWQRFLDQVPAEITDPAERQRRAGLLRKAHMKKLALKASAARSRRAKASANARWRGTDLARAEADEATA
jgi:hypothetical protein